MLWPGLVSTGINKSWRVSTSLDKCRQVSACLRTASQSAQPKRSWRCVASTKSRGKRRRQQIEFPKENGEKCFFFVWKVNFAAATKLFLFRKCANSKTKENIWRYLVASFFPLCSNFADIGLRKREALLCTELTSLGSCSEINFPGFCGGGAGSAVVRIPASWLSCPGPNPIGKIPAYNLTLCCDWPIKSFVLSISCFTDWSIPAYS